MAIPLSARFGDNVIERSASTPWYSGPTLSTIWKRSTSTPTPAARPFRMPVQWVNRPNLDFRGFAGTVAGGAVRRATRVAVAHSGAASTVTRIVTMDGDLERAGAGEAVTLMLADEIDVSRGDVLAAAGAARVVRPVRAASGLDGRRAAVPRPRYLYQARHPQPSRRTDHAIRTPHRRQHASSRCAAKRWS